MLEEFYFSLVSLKKPLKIIGIMIYLGVFVENQISTSSL